ncbi:MAG: hypothetical protein IPN76_27815 [Saprospiraceae bacterium]|nr:hypothetical protein [Saprospiraceae bacterium]
MACSKDSARPLFKGTSSKLVVFTVGFDGLEAVFRQPAGVFPRAKRAASGCFSSRNNVHERKASVYSVTTVRVFIASRMRFLAGVVAGAHGIAKQ